MIPKDGKFRSSSYTKFTRNKLCVEVARDDSGIRVRDSKDPNGSILSFTEREWDAFTKGVKEGEFDL
ncbi:MAG: DUF397 domain-containing protein [Candidatus Yanofskybacteria bacterium]|nr:DUF397 domain-containing protein [Candidatus Yanofskybacteria bacterium]